MSQTSLPGGSTYRTFSVSSDQFSGGNMSPSVQCFTKGVPGTPSYQPVNLSPVPMTNLQYASNGAAVDGNMVYGTLRYLVPVERRPMSESYVLVNSAPQVVSGQVVSGQVVSGQVVSGQVVSGQVVSPVYLQKAQYSANNYDDTDLSKYHRYIETESVADRTQSVHSLPPSPAKTPVSVTKEAEAVVEENKSSSSSSSSSFRVDTVVKTTTVEVKRDVPEAEPLEKLDTRFFGELLAEVYRKNSDIYAYITEHVAKIKGRKNLFEPTVDNKVEKAETEALIPKGMSELTKQQMRYLLQTRLTADKTQRLLLTTFGSLKEELIHLQDDLRRLESENVDLKKDLSFKSDQAQQYDRLLEAVRENNRQLQVSLKESISAQRILETQVMNVRGTDSDREYRIKELEGSRRALEQENQLLRQKLAGQGNSASFQVKTEELSKQYSEMLRSLRDEKDKELQALRSQLTKIQTEYSTKRSMGDSSLELRITELLTSLEQREIIIKRQEEEIKRLQQDVSSMNVSKKTIITNRYQNHYPILGLLGDDYQYTSPVKETKTIVFESTARV